MRWAHVHKSSGGRVGGVRVGAFGVAVGGVGVGVGVGLGCERSSWTWRVFTETKERALRVHSGK